MRDAAQSAVAPARRQRFAAGLSIQAVCQATESVLKLAPNRTIAPVL